LLRHENADN